MVVSSEDSEDEDGAICFDQQSPSGFQVEKVCELEYKFSSEPLVEFNSEQNILAVIENNKAEYLRVDVGKTIQKLVRSIDYECGTEVSQSFLSVHSEPVSQDLNE